MHNMDVDLESGNVNSDTRARPKIQRTRDGRVIPTRVHPFLTRQCVEGNHAIVRRRSASRDLRGRTRERPPLNPPPGDLLKEIEMAPSAIHGNDASNPPKVRKDRKPYRLAQLLARNSQAKVSNENLPLPGLPTIYQFDNSSFLHLFGDDKSVSTKETPIDQKSMLASKAPTTVMPQSSFSSQDSSQASSSGSSNSRSPSLTSSTSSAPTPDTPLTPDHVYWSNVSSPTFDKPLPRAPKVYPLGKPIERKATPSPHQRSVSEQPRLVKRSLDPKLTKPTDDVLRKAPSITRVRSHRRAASLSRGERLGKALQLHAQGLKLPDRPPSYRRPVSKERTVLPDVAKPPVPGISNSSKEVPAQASADSRPQSRESSDSCTTKPKHTNRPRRKSSLDQLIPQPLQKRAAAPQKVPSAKSLAKKQSKYDLSPRSAELVIFEIMSNLDSLADLLAFAMVNKGFYAVFRMHPLTLVGSILFRTNPSAWENLQTKFGESVKPTTYLNTFEQRSATISTLRTSILIRCDGVLRPETLAGLIRVDKLRSFAIDQALWRIWTFCDLFGAGAETRSELLAQSLWLSRYRAGGSMLIAGSKELRKARLSEDELFMMDEMWSCVNSLLQGYHAQIRAACLLGLFNGCQGDDMQTTEAYLKQWTAHVATLGLGAINTLSSCSFEDPDALEFLRWTPDSVDTPAFLREAIRDVLADRAMEKAAALSRAPTLPRKASGRARQAKTEPQPPLPENAGLRIQTQGLQRKAVGSPPTPRRTPSPSPIKTTAPWSPVSTQHHAFPPIPEYSKKERLSPMSPSSRRRMSCSSPTISADMFQTLALQPRASTQIGSTLFPSSTQQVPTKPAGQNLDTHPAHRHVVSSPAVTHRFVLDPIDKAMTLLVNGMGFAPAQARQALAQCETGVGLDVDHAVALLLGDASLAVKTPTTPAELPSPIPAGGQFLKMINQGQRQSHGPPPVAMPKVVMRRQSVSGHGPPPPMSPKMTGQRQSGHGPPPTSMQKRVAERRQSDAGHGPPPAAMMRPVTGRRQSLSEHGPPPSILKTASAYSRQSLSNHRPLPPVRQRSVSWQT